MITARLCDLGLTVKLIHDDGTTCGSESTKHQLTVLHTTGLHEISYWQCYCCRGKPNQGAGGAQLVANKLFPASKVSPRTAFTFDVLRSFDILNLEGSINIKQYCDSVLSLTPSRFKIGLEVRVPQSTESVTATHVTDVHQATGQLRETFHDAIRRWRLFRVMESYGYSSYADVENNGIVEACPQCPQPGVNLDPGWEDHPNA
jgi:hypothetical protein